LSALNALLLILYQSDSTTAPTAAQATSGIVDLMGNIGAVAMCVLVLLLIASLYSWTIILGKISTFSRATKESKRFIREFRKATRLQEISALAVKCKASPLAMVFEDVYETYKRQTGGSGPPRNLAPLERSAQTAASESITNLERRLTWLATIASTSPFVGLFGTVWGIIDAFHGLGTAGAATMRAVAPGMAEALITTAAGLFVAVPAVVAYNQFSARVRIFASATDDFCRELLNSLEEIPIRSAQAARQPGPESLAGPATGQVQGGR
jgi:biopolymer transport protein TolQ